MSALYFQSPQGETAPADSHMTKDWAIISRTRVCVFISVYWERGGRWRLQPESGEQMDRQHRGALPHTAGQTGETVQVHRYVLLCVLWSYGRVGVDFTIKFTFSALKNLKFFLFWFPKVLFYTYILKWSKVHIVFLRTVTCAVMQKTGAGLHTANSCYWDTAMDGKQSFHCWFTVRGSRCSENHHRKVFL